MARRSNAARRALTSSSTCLSEVTKRAIRRPSARRWRSSKKAAQAASNSRAACVSEARIRAIVAAGIPVVGHIGVLPQTAGLGGGFRRRRDRELLLADAHAVADAGASAVVLEMVDAALAAEITQATSDSDDRNRCGSVLRRPSSGFARRSRLVSRIAAVRTPFRGPQRRRDLGLERFRDGRARPFVPWVTAHIVAAGGGVLLPDSGNLKLEKYCLSLARKSESARTLHWNGERRRPGLPCAFLRVVRTARLPDRAPSVLPAHADRLARVRL